MYSFKEHIYVFRGLMTAEMGLQNVAPVGEVYMCAMA